MDFFRGWSSELHETAFFFLYYNLLLVSMRNSLISPRSPSIKTENWTFSSLNQSCLTGAKFCRLTYLYVSLTSVCEIRRNFSSALTSRQILLSRGISFRYCDPRFTRVKMIEKIPILHALNLSISPYSQAVPTMLFNISLWLDSRDAVPLGTV